MTLGEKIRTSFPGRRVAIIGDLVADQFLRGTISRVSREAPVFILRHDETETVPGGAANAAANVAAMGGSPLLVGVAGDDENGRLLRSRLREMGVSTDLVVAAPDIRTTTKVRVLAGQHYARRQQVIRIDYENRGWYGDDIRQRLALNAETAIAEADAVIVSDYGYGVASPELYDAARRVSSEKGIPLITDSRFRLGEFCGADSATPNQDEAEQLLQKEADENTCEELRAMLGLRSLLVTRGNRGMILIEKGVAPVMIDAVGPSEPVDVTGAGDTVIAAYALGIASGLSFFEAACAANHAGSIVVMKKGTAAATLAELLASIGAGSDAAARTEAAS
jgi:D-glycero-beta-D-manno-heptose-7-phosphate kinase